MKKVLTAFILTLLLLGLFFVASTVFGSNVSNTIDSDATWTKANSPYTLTGSVTVKSGATLTIEPGVTVNIGKDVYLQIDGTLVAKGTNTDNIHLSGAGDVILMPNSTNWNQNTSSGTIIENAIVNGISLTVCNSAKINNNTILGYINVDGGSPQITWNSIAGGVYANES